MFSPELEKLIEFTLADGRLTDQERAVLETAAKKEGVDMNQLEVYIQYRLYQRKEEEIKQSEARKYNEPIGKVKRCPNCFELLEDQYRFCPKCQTPVADDSTADTSVNLGNANAICGGVNINRSKNITSCDTHYHSTTIQERIKSDAEIKLDAINQLRSKAEELIGERGRIDSIAITMLKPLASQLGIDDETFKTTIKEVISNRSGCTSGLSSINARYLSQAQQAVQTNDIESLSGLFPRLEAIAAISQDDNVQYLYYLALSLLYPAKCIEVYEQQTDENYWRTFWAIITYIKVGNWVTATKELANLQPSLFEKAEEDLNVLEALFNLVKKDKDCAQDFLDDILGETSPQIAPFLRAIEIALYEEECESPEVRFYSEQVVAKICQTDKKPIQVEEKPIEIKAEQTEYDVILKSAGQAKLGVVKAVYQMGLGLKEAKEIVDKAPVVVVKNVSKAKAEALKAALEEEGATVEIRGVGGTEPVISVSSTGNTDGEKKTAFDVILVSAGQAKLGVVKTVKWEMGLGFKEAKEIVDKAPVVVVKNVSKAKAEALKAALEEAGAEAEIK